MIDAPVLQDAVCGHCGKAIALIKTGVNAHKWVSNTKDRGTWRCGGDPNFPLRSHSPRAVPKGDDTDDDRH